MFKVIQKDKSSQARVGKLATAHGEVDTPCFMPVGTQGTVKMLSVRDLHETNAQIILSNAYHLSLRPGIEVIEQAGGLHKFMNWDKPILTDSGGYQIFSMSSPKSKPNVSRKKTSLFEVTDEKVTFKSLIDGTIHCLTPEKVIEIETALGVDILMPLDECVEYPTDKSYAQVALNRTLHWAERSKKAFKAKGNFLFGIVQGASYPDLRSECIKELCDIGFDGYALGGLCVGEDRQLRNEMISQISAQLPDNRPRYLMGMGKPHELVEAVMHGVDMFDCIIPTRFGRNGSAFTHEGKIIVRDAPFTKDFRPIDPDCECFACRTYTRSYIRHLFNTDELLGLYLVSLHNVHFYISLMSQIRDSINNSTLDILKEKYEALY